MPTHKVRMHHEHADAGGGGVNVARVIHALGGHTLAIIAAGGASGRVLEEMLDEAGVPRRSVLIQGRTRVSLNVLDTHSGLEYRFVPEGPTLSAAEYQAFLDAIGADSDISAWIGTKTDPFNNHLTLSDALLTSLGYTEENLSNTSVTSRWADINSVGRSGNVLVIGALSSDTSPEDEFKISKLTTKCK